MKRVNFILVIILMITAGCSENRQSNDSLITIEVTKSYPKKELILQDIFDVEYIALETNEEFVTSSFILNIGKSIIAVRNSGVITEGDIFFFDRTGKGLRKINRRGQGPGEYIAVQILVLDEDNNEMFVFDMSVNSFILVYDLYGNFKRHLENPRELEPFSIANFDHDHLIIHDSGYLNIVNGNIEGIRNQFFILSLKSASKKFCRFRKEITVYWG